MPRLLKKDAIRLLEASVESLNLALVGLGLPQRVTLKEVSAQYSGAIGLIGASVELDMAGCVIQAFGKQALLLPTGHYKSAAEIHDEFKKLLRDAPPIASFLTRGIADEPRHRASLLDCTKGFRRLIAARAGGLHAGNGRNREICVVLAQEAATFLDQLGRSDRIKSYLSVVPRPNEKIVSRLTLAEDLASKLAREKDSEAQSKLLSALYLILPDIPDEQPDWLSAFERVSISPKKRDLAILLEAINQCVPGQLKKVSKDIGNSIPVVVRPDDPDALPIAPQYLRTEFSRMPDQWRADVANANGRLNQGLLHIPPIEFVKEIFVLGLDKIDVLNPKGELSAHEVWPFVISSLSVQGTPGPYWFLIRRTPDLGQLRALIEKAAELGSGYLKRNTQEVLAGIEAIMQGKPVASTVKGIRDLTALSKASEGNRERLADIARRLDGTDRTLSKSLLTEVEKIVREETPIGPMLLTIVEAKTAIREEARIYWVRILAESAFEREDLPGLLALTRCQALLGAHTAARKAIRLIDYLENGPQI